MKKKALEKAQSMALNDNYNEHIDIMLFRYGRFYPAPTAILSDNLLLSLGYTIWWQGRWDECDYFTLLQWYAENFGIQKTASETIVLRTFLDFSQSLVNVQNRVEKMFEDLMKSNHPPIIYDIKENKVKEYVENYENMPIDPELKNTIKTLTTANLWISDKIDKQNSVNIPEILLRGLAKIILTIGNDCGTIDICLTKNRKTWY